MRLKPETIERRAHQKAITKKLRKRAKECRLARTGAEDFLWKQLRDNTNERRCRQVIVSCMIVDIALPMRNLLIEVNGKCHRDKADVARARKLEHFGFKVLMFTNEEVESQIDRVIKCILAVPSSKERHERYLLAMRTARRHRLVEGMSWPQEDQV